MTFLPIIILAIVQGLTEFLPVSSSGHLLLVHTLIGNDRMPQSRMILDVAMHVGTLMAVFVYFRKDLLKMLQGVLHLTKRDFSNENARLNINMVIASIPVVLVGLLIHEFQPSWIGLVEIMAWTTIFFGALLWLADRTPDNGKTLMEMTPREAFLIGLAQAFSLMPGTSRSGVTMTAARFLGYDRTESARFSLFLAIIAISGAGALEGIALFRSMDSQLGIDAAVGAFIAFLAGWGAIAFMMRFLKKYSFAPFAIYRIISGILILGLIYGGVWTP